MQPRQKAAEQWATICNMRTTLLQLQFLYSSTASSLEEQLQKFNLHQKDRLLQINRLSEEVASYRMRNFNSLLIVKLESLIGIYEPLDRQIWEDLTDFMHYVEIVE